MELEEKRKLTCVLIGMRKQLADVITACRLKIDTSPPASFNSISKALRDMDLQYDALNLACQELTSKYDVKTIGEGSEAAQ